MPPKPTHMFATITTPGTKKVSVCTRRIGSRDRMAVIAVCTHEGDADMIVDGLNLMQGKLFELEVPAQRVLEEVRSALTAERGVSTALQVKIRELENKLRDAHRERDIAQHDLRRALDLRKTQTASEIADVLVATGNG